MEQTSEDQLTASYEAFMSAVTAEEKELRGKEMIRAIFGPSSLPTDSNET